MILTTLHIMYMAFIIIGEGQIYVSSSNSQKVAALNGAISEKDTENNTVSEDMKNISVEVGNDIVENQRDILVSNNNINLEIENKYIAHHRGNRRYFADKYSEKKSDIPNGNYNVKEANDYSNVDDSSKEVLDSNIISNAYSREVTKHYAKDLGKIINKKNEYENISNSVIDLQDGIIEDKKILNTAKMYKEIFDTGDNFGEFNENHDFMEGPVKQSIKNEEQTVRIDEESYEYEKNDDESYIMPDVESFWDAVDTFINIHSEHPEMEDSQESEDLYEYLYTPSGNSPGIDPFLDLLLFVKDLRDSVERIGTDTQWTGEIDSIYENLETSPMELRKVYEVNKNMNKNKDDYMSQEEYRIYKREKKKNKNRFNRSKRSLKSRNDNEVSRILLNDGKSYQHKTFFSSFSMSFPILEFDLLLSSFEFEPLKDPFPVDQ